MELEELQKSFLELSDNHKKVSDEKTSLEKRLEEEVQRNNKLQATNHELFLRVTSPTPQEPKQAEKPLTTDDIVEQYKKGHKL